MPIALRPPSWTPPAWSVRLLVCALLTLASTYDGLATLELLSRGMWREGNPLIAPAIEWSPTYFAAWKSLAPLAIGLLACWGTSRFRPIWWLFCLAAVAYATLAGYHVYLLYIFVPPA